jgi:betaine-aldehyde dehydrogenase
MSAIAAFNRLSGQQRIAGELVRSRADAAIDVLDPATEERIGEITDATPLEVDQAVGAANAAQRAWRSVNYHRRAELLHAVARQVEADRPLVAEMLTREMGKPYKESFDEVGWSVSAIDYYAEIARHEAGKVLGAAVDGQFHFTTKDPLGVVVIILPFNYPLCLLCWQATAALASGNAVIIKPSDLTTLTTLQFTAAFDALPSGLVQVLSGGGEVGKRLVEHPDTHMVAFTGGIETGRRVA